MKPIQKTSAKLLLFCGLLLLFSFPVHTSAATRPLKIQGLKSGVTTKSSINLSWTGQFNVSGYQIYRSYAYDGKYKKLKDVSPEMNAFCNRKLSAGREYYYKVRAYTVSDNNIIYGKFSKIKKARTKMPFPQKAVIRIRANIRKNAGTNHPILATADANTPVSVICFTQDKSGNAWCYVSCKVNKRTIKGYISQNLLQTQQKIAKQYGQVTAFRLNVRTGPSTGNPVIASLNHGQKVTILDQSKSLDDGSVWYLISFKQNGKTRKGYASSKYIKLI